MLHFDHFPESPGYILCFDAFCSLLTLDTKDITQQRWQTKSIESICFLHVTFSQVLDTTACLRQSECCLMHLAERHMHQLGCWVKRYSWDDEMTCQIWGILS